MAGVTTTMPRFAAYLFDLDGTLVDTAPDINAALNHSLTRFDLPPVAAALTRHWVGHGSRTLIGEALRHHGAAHVDIDQLLEPFLDYYEAHLANHSRIYPGVTETLDVLRAQGARLAVVTNKSRRLTHPLLAQIGLAEYFELVICGDTASAPKPDPAPVRYCLDHFGLGPESAVIVGDSNTDVQAGRAAGIAVVCVRDGYNHGIDVTTLDVDAVIDHFDELVT